jgi:hypothetical protein
MIGMIFKGMCPMCGGNENDIIKMEYEVSQFDDVGSIPIVNLRCACRNGCHHFSVSGDGKCATEILDQVDTAGEIRNVSQICTKL